VLCLGPAYSQNLKQYAAIHVSKFLIRVSLVTTSSLLLAHLGFYLISSATGNGHLVANRFVANRSIIADELWHAIVWGVDTVRNSFLDYGRSCVSVVKLFGSAYSW
jgi:hypothetical protein